MTIEPGSRDDPFREFLRCDGCGVPVRLMLTQVGDRIIETWEDLRSSTFHFNPEPGYPLLVAHHVGIKK